MTFEMFEKEILKHLQKKKSEDMHISIEHIRKNNDETWSGLQIRKEGRTVIPVLYLEEYYRYFLICQDFDYIVEKIWRDYEIACQQMPKTLTGVINYEYIKDRIIYRLINYEKNKEILQDCPYIKLYDLAVSFRWVAYTDERGLGSALITNKEMDLWNVTTQDLILAAQNNTEKLFPARIIPIDEVLEEAGMSYDRPGALDMYICTNNIKLNGASVILYQEVLKNFAQEHKSDFYILPSSIHEVLLVPVEECEEEEEQEQLLFSLIQEANSTVVELGEILSDSLYCYRWKEEKLELIM